MTSLNGQPVLELVVDAVRGAERLLCIGHVNPDGDAVGSLLAMGWLLSDLGKDRVLAIEDAVPPVFRFLPGWEEITDKPWGEFDVVVSLDSSDPSRMGEVYDQARHGNLPLLNIDHHVTNVSFGAMNWVDPEVASTAEMVYRLALALEVPIKPEMAQCLLVGVVTDTRGFRTSNTTPNVLRVATELMEAGADLTEITELALNRHPLAVVRLWGELLPGARLDGGIIYAEVTQAMRERAGMDEDSSDGGVVSFLLGAQEADVAAVFNEKKDGRVDVSMRAKPGFDVSAVALALGGGGHPQAAGCMLEGPFQVARQQVLRALRRSLDEQRRSMAVVNPE